MNIYQVSLLFSKRNFCRVIAFHSISNEATSPKKFSDFLDLIISLNIKIISFDTYRKLKEIRGRYLILHFDDGYKDNIDVLLPILQKRNITATIYLATNHLGKNKNHSDLIDYKMYNENILSSQDVQLWLNSGMEIGFHTHNHIDLYETKNEDIVKDFSNGFSVLDKFDSSKKNFTKTFVYPFGYLPKKEDRTNVKNLLEENNFNYAFCTVWGELNSNDDNMYMKRTCIGDNDNLLKMLLKSIGIFDYYYDKRYVNEKNRI